MNKLITLIILALWLSACAGQSGDRISLVPVSIQNSTDLPLSIFYAQEDGKYTGDTSVAQKSITIEASQTQQIEIRRDFWDGDFTAVYNGNVRVFDVNFSTQPDTPLEIVVADFQ